MRLHLHIYERWLWLRADLSGWWWRHGFTLIRKSELARLRHDLHYNRLLVRAHRRREKFPDYN
jgi:hypothetical protein